VSIALVTQGYIVEQGYQFPPATPMTADATFDPAPVPPMVVEAEVVPDEDPTP